MFGRDKYYKLTILMDIPVMIRLQQEDPDIITMDVFLDLFTFYWEYANRCCFLPG